MTDEDWRVLGVLEALTLFGAVALVALLIGLGAIALFWTNA